LIILREKLGLVKEDFDDIFCYESGLKEHSSFSIGPPWYPGTKYGTISIDVF
jgi:hypothetical protein